VWGRGESLTGFWWELKEREHLKDLDADWRIVLKWIFNN
jgi:hypothetical protein